MTKAIEVVGGIILRNGLVLCAQRGPSGALPGLWEFPGGKIEVDETPENALRRELREELNADVIVGDFVDHTIYAYSFGDISLSTYYCDLLSESVTRTQHKALAWLPPERMFDLEWAPADVPAVNSVVANHKTEPGA